MRMSRIIFFVCMFFFISCSKHDSYSVNVIIEVDNVGEFNISAVNFLISNDTKVGSKIIHSDEGHYITRVTHGANFADLYIYQSDNKSQHLMIDNIGTDCLKLDIEIVTQELRTNASSSLLNVTIPPKSSKKINL